MPNVLPVDTIGLIFEFLFPVDQWSLRCVARSWREAVDTQTDAFYPFAVVRLDRPTIIGTFCFSRQEVLLVTTTHALRQVVTYGKARNVDYPNVDDVSEGIAQALDALVPNRVKSVLVATDAAASSSGGAGETFVRTAEYVVDPPSVRGATNHCRTFFAFCDGAYSKAVASIQRRLNAGKQGDGASLRDAAAPASLSVLPIVTCPLGDGMVAESSPSVLDAVRALLPGSTGNTSTTVLLPDAQSNAAFYAVLQHIIHKSIMTYVAPLASCSKSLGGDDAADAGSLRNRGVPGYNCYYGRGAVVLSYDEATNLFGQPSSSSSFGVSGGGFEDRRLSMRATGVCPCAIIPWDGLPLFEGAPSWRLFDAEDVAARQMGIAASLQDSVWLVRNETCYVVGGDGSGSSNTNALSRYQSPLSSAMIAFHKKYPNSKLHVGTTPSGLEAVLETTCAVNASMQFHFAAPNEHRAPRLYITDNTFFAEVFDEAFLLPTKLLRHSWSQLQRDADAESRAPCINGRPLTTPWILWGPLGTCSSAHVEPSGSCVWVHIFHGAKRWCVFNDAAQRWESFAQRAGETVFMGRGIWHAVVNTDPDTFAIACNYIPLA